MKKRNILMSIILTLALVAPIISGCSGSKEKREDSSTSKPAATATAGERGKFTIGYNYFVSSSYALLALANNTQVVIDAFGNKAVAMNDEGSVEKIVQDVENMISSGCDGLVLWLPVDSLYVTISDMCKKAKVPFVLSDKVPSDPAIVRKLKANPYFAGAVAPDNAVYGQKIAEYALAHGYKSTIVSGASVGDPSDTPRLNAFKKTYEAGGGKILTELHSKSGDEIKTQIEDALVAYKTPDFIYGIGSDYALIACDSLSSQGINCPVLTSGLDKNALEYLVDGKIKMINGDAWISGMFATIALQNYLDGTPLKDADGNAVWINNIQPFAISANQYNLYKKFFLDHFCYTNEELQQMSGKSNSDYTYEAFVQAIGGYSLRNRLLAKYNAGEVTKDELTAVGVSVK